MKPVNLERRLVAAVLLVSGTLAVIATAAQLWVDWRRDRDAVGQELRGLAGTYVSSVEEALWVADRGLLGASLQGIAGLPDVTGVSVEEVGQAPFEVGTSARADVTHTFPLSHSYRGREVALGTLRVHASLDHAVQRMWERLTVILATNFAKTLLVSLVMLWVFRRLVTRHLRRIAGHARAVELEGPEPDPLELRGGRGPPAAELLQVAAALNDLQERAHRQLGQLKAADLRNRELNTQLDAQVKELERFGYSLSHDLRQSLRTIASFSEILEEDLAETADAASLDLLRRVNAATGRMSTTVDAMLVLHQLSTREIRREPVDVGGLARAIAADLSAAAPERDVRWTLPEGLTTEADPALLAIALENLLGNAFKYSAGQPVAHIELSHEVLPDGRSVFAVRDDGVGFDESEARRIFEPFQRIDAGHAIDGSGVGLATVERVVHRHGGEVWFESTPGGGATFRFTLAQEAR